MTNATASVIGVDWGTSNRRAYVLDAAGRCLTELADDQGMLAARGRFEAALGELLAPLHDLPADTPVLMSGMVGSAQGWREAPYLPADTALRELSQHLMPVDAPRLGRRCAIVPGLRFDAGERVDVMRGEETELLGAVALGLRDGWFVLPGTHSKWVELRGGRVQQFATYMTGELFALLSGQGTLSAMVSGPQCADETALAAAFAAGVDAAGAGALSNTLFGCRARVVSGRAPSDTSAAYLSGLLIGAEWSDVRERNGGAWPDSIYALGNAALASRHADSARLFGRTLTILDARRAYLAALVTLREGL